MGAWIETVALLFYGRPLRSHPTWVRGLKLIHNVVDLTEVNVAPYVGAWIETFIVLTWLDVNKSHPTWVRGLKLNAYAFITSRYGRTLRGCVD